MLAQINLVSPDLLEYRDMWSGFEIRQTRLLCNMQGCVFIFSKLGKLKRCSRKIY